MKSVQCVTFCAFCYQPKPCRNGCARRAFIGNTRGLRKAAYEVKCSHCGVRVWHEPQQMGTKRSYNGGRAGSAGEASNASACGGGGSGGEPTWQSGAVCGVGQPPTLLGSLEREYQHGREDALQEFADWQPTPEQAHEAVRIYKEITATCKNDSDWEQKPIGLRWLQAFQRVFVKQGEKHGG